MASVTVPPPPPAPPAATPIEFRRHRCFVRKNWADQWVPVDYLECLQISRALAPSIPQARFDWKIGTIKWEDATEPVRFEGLGYIGYFVKVEILPTQAEAAAQTAAGNTTPPQNEVRFVGRFVDDDYDVKGPRTATTTTDSIVDQGFTAVGLAYELDRNPIRTSVVENGNDQPLRVDAPVTFNEKYSRGYSEIGNRSDATMTLTEDGVDQTGYVLSDDANAWTLRQIVEHLLAFHAPSGIKLKLAGAVGALEVYAPARADVYGRTLWCALNQLLDRKRGLLFHLFYVPGTPGAETLELRVDTTVGQPVPIPTDLPGAGENPELPANADKIALLDIKPTSTALPAVFRAAVARTQFAGYGKIIVYGDRLLSCFTLTIEESALEKAWTTDDEAAYKAGAGGADAAKNDAYRADDKFDHVFSTYRIPKTWNWQSKQAAGTGASPQICNPTINIADGKLKKNGNDFVQPTLARTWGLRFERFLPLRTPESVNLPEPKYRDMLMLIKADPVAPATVPSYTMGDRAAGIRNFGPEENQFGLSVQASEKLNHLFGKGTFDAGSPAATASGVQPVYDYRKLIWTVAVRLDERPRVEVTLEGGDPTRVLHIEVPGAETWYVAPNTVVGLKADNTLERSSGDPVVRDDSARLREVAALAKAWFTPIRSALTLEGRTIWSGLQLGQYITECDQSDARLTVNSVISTITDDLRNGTTTVLTAFTELDFAGGTGKRKGRKR